MRVAGLLARYLWWWMLYFMRRPWMKHLQRRTMEVVPSFNRERTRRSFAQQNAFARRYGLLLLTIAMNLLLASIILTVCVEVVLWLVDGGYLQVPDNLREKIDSGS